MCCPGDEGLHMAWQWLHDWLWCTMKGHAAVVGGNALPIDAVAERWRRLMRRVSDKCLHNKETYPVVALRRSRRLFSLYG